MKRAAGPQPAGAPCHACAYVVGPDSRANGSGWRPPQPGDLSVCLNCGTFGIFTPEMALRAALPEEFAKLPEEAITYQFAIRYRGLLFETPGTST